ncbi:MAG: radical SAM protein [Nanoarchaeota archaeon]
MKKFNPKILLIMPRSGLIDKPDYNYSFALGLAYISAVLKKEGYNVDCLNFNHLNGTIDSLVISHIKNKNYNFIGFGHNALSYSVIESMIISIRKHSPNSKIILGGPIITTESELMFKSLKPDVAVLGEGEKTILELIKCLMDKKDLSKIKGIGYRNEFGKICFTEKREVVQDLDSLPYPDFEGFDFKKKVENTPLSEYPILASRGCPFSCSFCYHEGRYRLRGMKEVFKELNIAVKKYRTNMILLYDDCFAMDKKRLLEFCDGIKKLKSEISWDLKWSPQLTVHSVDGDLLKIMKEAGCELISYGFESFSPIVLKSMGKPITPQQIDNAIKETLKAKIAIQANFIFGDIAETKETAEETLNYWKNHCKGQVNLTLIEPYPGSRIYDYCVKKGIIKDKLFFIKHQMGRIFYTDFNMSSMNNKDFEKFKRKMVNYKFKYSGIGKIPVVNGNQLKVTCPFCKKRITYENIRFENHWIYNFYVVCKNCKMRFYAISDLKKAVLPIYNLVKPLYEIYLNIKRNLAK